MNSTKLEKYPREHGCHIARRTGGHDFWHNPQQGGYAAVPRHNEIKWGTVRSICKTLNIPMPAAGR